MAQSATVSEGKLVEAIQALLERKFGRSEAKAIDFYADTDIALANPSEYATLLLNIFGIGAEHLLAAIVDGLGEAFGVKVDERTTLDELINRLKPKPVG